MKYALIPILFLVAGCVPNEIHQQDQARISELLGHIAELQNQVAAIMATQRILESVCVVNGMLLGVCLIVLWMRMRRKGGVC